MNFELLRIAAALAGTGLAAWEDGRTSFIDDRITFSMIGLGFLLNLWAWLGMGDWNFFVASCLPAALVLAVGYLLYRYGQLGGGDVLLFAGIQLLLPFYPFEALAPVQAALGTGLPEFAAEVSANWPLLLSVFVASSALAMVGSGAQYSFLLWKKHKDFKGLKPDWQMLLAASALAVPALFFASTAFSPMRTAFFAAVFLPGVLLVGFKKQLMDEVIVKRIRIEEIEDEDILAIDKMDAKVVEKYGLERVLTKEQVGRLRK